ncbi:MAG TPA: response regulator [Candidatus Paceibacterota bacterium]
MPSVLIVDDEPALGKMIGIFVTGIGWEYQIVSNGEEAIRMLQEKSPNLVISDFSMPVMNGLQLLAYMRSNDVFKDVPFIMISSGDPRNLERDVLAEAMELGANAVLSKPFQLSTLAQTIEEVRQEK